MKPLIETSLQSIFSGSFVGFGGKNLQIQNGEHQVSVCDFSEAYFQSFCVL